MKFSKVDLEDLECDEGSFDAYTFISKELTGRSRWHSHYTLTFGYSDGKFYQVKYQSGATEMQDDYPFDDEGDEVECYEVVPVEKTVIVYEKVAK
jgi:hypothetical protein